MVPDEISGARFLPLCMIVLWKCYFSQIHFKSYIPFFSFVGFLCKRQRLVKFLP